MSAMVEEKLLTIGTVCGRLKDEFPDISISKIRYLEDQGLLTPKRTSGGYRLFSENDVERLTTILRLQRDEFLPLRVIRQELASPTSKDRRRKRRAGLAGPSEARGRGVRRAGRRPARAGARAGGVRPAHAGDGRGTEALSRGRRGRGAPLRRLAEFGVGPRHLRTLRTSADRTAGLIEAVTAPALRARSPSGGRRGSRTCARSVSSRRSSRPCCCGASSAGRQASSGDPYRRRPQGARPRRPGLPEAGDRLQGHHAAARGPDALRFTVDQLAEWVEPRKPDLILGAEARGFITGGAVACRLGCGFVAARKPGKLPWRTVSAKYALEYGYDVLELHADAIHSGQRVVVHDDLLATGGTAKAKCELVEQLGGEVVGVAFIISLDFLDGRERLADYDVFSLIHY